MNAHVYLDVDGVLNAVTTDHDPGWGWGRSEVVTVNGFQIRYSPTMVDALNSLSERLSFIWLTTWREDAPGLLAPAIGLRGESWPVLDAPEPIGAPWWKLSAIREHIAATKPDRSFWIDDDIVFDREARDWLAITPDVIAISPRTHVGLKRQALDTLVEAARP